MGEYSKNTEYGVRGCTLGGNLKDWKFCLENRDRHYPMNGTSNRWGGGKKRNRHQNDADF